MQATDVCIEKQILRNIKIKYTKEHPVGGSNNLYLTC